MQTREIIPDYYNKLIFLGFTTKQIQLLSADPATCKMLVNYAPIYRCHGYNAQYLFSLYEKSPFADPKSRIQTEVSNFMKHASEKDKDYFHALETTFSSVQKFQIFQKYYPVLKNVIQKINTQFSIKIASIASEIEIYKELALFIKNLFITRKKRKMVEIKIEHFIKNLNLLKSDTLDEHIKKMLTENSLSHLILMQSYDQKCWPTRFKYMAIYNSKIKKLDALMQSEIGTIFKTSILDSSFNGILFPYCFLLAFLEKKIIAGNILTDTAKKTLNTEEVDDENISTIIRLIINNQFIVPYPYEEDIFLKNNIKNPKNKIREFFLTDNKNKLISHEETIKHHISEITCGFLNSVKNKLALEKSQTDNATFSLSSLDTSSNTKEIIDLTDEQPVSSKRVREEQAEHAEMAAPTKRQKVMTSSSSSSSSSSGIISIGLFGQQNSSNATFEFDFELDELASTLRFMP